MSIIHTKLLENYAQLYRGRDVKQNMETISRNPTENIDETQTKVSDSIITSSSFTHDKDQPLEDKEYDGSSTKGQLTDINFENNTTKIISGHKNISNISSSNLPRNAQLGESMTDFTIIDKTKETFNFKDMEDAVLDKVFTDYDEEQILSTQDTREVVNKDYEQLFENIVDKSTLILKESNGFHSNVDDNMEHIDETSTQIGLSSDNKTAASAEKTVAAVTETMASNNHLLSFEGQYRVDETVNGDRVIKVGFPYNLGQL